VTETRAEAVQRLGVQHKLAAFRLGGRGCHRHLAAELVRGSRFAFADAFDKQVGDHFYSRLQRLEPDLAVPSVVEPDIFLDGAHDAEGYANQHCKRITEDSVTQPHSLRVLSLPGLSMPAFWLGLLVVMRLPLKRILQ